MRRSRQKFGDRGFDGALTSIGFEEWGLWPDQEQNVWPPRPYREGGSHDSQAFERRLSALFTEEESAHGQTPQPRNVQDAGCGSPARARGPVLQAALRHPSRSREPNSVDATPERATPR